ncbi:SDR family NAD(P)-dependent oxidoreductase [Nocardia brasiliensis]|uniref:SDR family NAD(P)-dependent oxidoreductase n=1 Tax=Nocardia brasiliensis TaxID=37326 RepID=UPI003D8D1959
MSKVWFITGVSRGLGREWAAAALERGDRVAGTARDLTALAGQAGEFPETFLPLRLDVTDRTGVHAAVEQAVQHFGHLDIVVNNAGFAQFGMVEELTEEQIRAELETNLLGPLWVTQAVLPYLRTRGAGHIIQVSSVWGLLAAANTGAYSASKWALEGLSQSLADEVAGFGIHVTVLEPASYDTGFALTRFTTANAVYDAARAAIDYSGQPLGAPRATRSALLAVVDADKPPRRLLLGQGALRYVTTEYEARMAQWREWASVSEAAQGN